MKRLLTKMLCVVRKCKSWKLEGGNWMYSSKICKVYFTFSK